MTTVYIPKIFHAKVNFSDSVTYLKGWGNAAVNPGAHYSFL